MLGKKHRSIGFAVSASFFCLAVSLAFAVTQEETPASSSGGPTGYVSTPTPQILSAEGQIESLDLRSPVPSLRMVSSPKNIHLILDKNVTTVWVNNQMKDFSDLKAGQKIKVRHMIKDGKDVAKSIDIQ